MSALLLLLVPGLPLALALALATAPGRAAAPSLAPVAPLPALAAAAALPAGTETTFEWLLFGLRLGIDGPGRMLLGATALLWLAGALEARRRYDGDPRAARFFAFFLAAAGGNLGVAVALDAVGLYLFYALMSLAAYGLVVHRGDAPAHRAGRIYIGFAVLGEVLVLFGLVGLAASAVGIALPLVHREPPAAWAALLLLAGFGTKAGLLPLHGALPVSYRVLSPAAGTVLAGAMLHAGLLGWVRLLPMDALAPPVLAPVMLLAGLAGALFGAAVGLVQREPRALLAYSSLSQIGWMLVILGAGRWHGEGSGLLLVSLYAVHHALAKGALFLGIDAVGAAAARRGRWLALAALAVPALSIAGLPGFPGQLAKAGLKASLAALPEASSSVLSWLLPLGALATALLMARLLWLLAQAGPSAGERPGVAAWGGLLLASLAVPWALAASLLPALPTLRASAAWAALWPLLTAGALAAWVARKKPARLSRFVGAVPPGDLLGPVLRRGDPLRRRLAAFGAERRGRPGADLPRPVPDGTRAEHLLRRWQTAGLLFLLLLLLSLGLLWLPG